MVNSPSDPGVLIYNGKPYATGLLWFTVQEDTDKGLLQQRINKTHADFYCLRQHISTQQGFGWLKKGHKRGMPVAAAMIADQLVGEWHGVFEADNGWWYVQVRSDTITPNGDRFFTSEEEAFNLFQSEMQRHNWPHAYAPEKWRISEANIRELPLKNLLDDFASTKLVGANITAAFGGAAQRNAVGAVLLATFAVMAGLMLYTVTKSDEINIPAPSVTIQPRIKPILAPAANPTNEFISPQQMLTQCGDAAAQLLIALPGWNIQKFYCAPGAATMSWQQGMGTLMQAKQQGATKWPDKTGVTFANNLMTAAVTLEKLPKLQPEKLPKQDEALLTLEQDLQPLGALQVKPVVPTAPPAPPVSRFSTEPPPPPPVAPPPYLDIQFLSGFGPEKVAPFLQQPGLEVLSAEWTVPRATWQYKLKWTHAKNTPAAAPTAVPGGK